MRLQSHFRANSKACDPQKADGDYTVPSHDPLRSRRCSARKGQLTWKWGGLGTQGKTLALFIAAIGKIPNPSVPFRCYRVTWWPRGCKGLWVECKDVADDLTPFMFPPTIPCSLHGTRGSYRLSVFAQAIAHGDAIGWPPLPDSPSMGGEGCVCRMEGKRDFKGLKVPFVSPLHPWFAVSFLMFNSPALSLLWGYGGDFL